MDYMVYMQREHNIEYKHTNILVEMDFPMGLFSKDFHFTVINNGVLQYETTDMKNE